jgi:hypothetical protein
MSSTDLAGFEISPFDLRLPRFSPDEIVGRTFLNQFDDGQTYRDKILKRSKTTMQRTTERSSSWKLAMAILMKLYPTTPCVTWLKTQMKTSLKKRNPGFSNLSKNNKATSRGKIQPTKDLATMY